VRFLLEIIRKFNNLEVLVLMTPINYDLPEEVSMMKDTVRDLAEKVIAPVAEELDVKQFGLPRKFDLFELLF
jgi:hypothetical protein